LRAGASYEAPTPPSREGADGILSPDRWRQLLSGAPQEDRRRALVSSVAWTSPINAAALLRPDLPPEEALVEGHGLWRTLASGTAASSPTLLDLPKGRQPYPWSLPGIEGRSVGSLLEALEIWSLDRHDSSAVAAALPQELFGALERALDQAQRRVTSLVAELEALEEPAALRAVGDLLLARLHEVPSGVDHVVLADFEGQPVSITLDPARPPHENAHSYYDRAARARIPEMIRDADKAALKLEALLARARRGEASAGEIRGALPSDSRRPTRGAAEVSLPYRVYRSSGGLEIRVGRGARHNDDLTFRHAAPDDIWLHARHASGAHVILRWTGPGNPPARDLEEAAVLAALHSRARTSGSVPVDWTRRKHVRKPRGSAPGAVVPQRVSTVFVEPDSDRADGLKGE
jgi:hypothetical protein